MSSAEAGLRAAAYTTFLKYWRDLTPHIVVMKPMSDLCWVCQKNSSAILKTRNMPDEMKSSVSNDNIKTYSYVKFICTVSFRQYLPQRNTWSWYRQSGNTTKMHARHQQQC